MNCSFGIITDGRNDAYIREIIATIIIEQIPYYEIIIVGPSKIKETPIIRIVNRPDCEYLPSNPKLGWITKKKNIIAQEARYDHIVFMHDYIKLELGWYKGWLNFFQETKFEIAVNKILTLDGLRHSDWCVDSYLMWEAIPESKNNYDVLLPYEFCGLSKIQYISGGYWVAKSDFMRKFPLNETLGWGEAEDIEWSRRIRDTTEFKINTYSSVKLMKPNKWAPRFISQERLNKVLLFKELI